MASKPSCRTCGGCKYKGKAKPLFKNEAGNEILNYIKIITGLGLDDLPNMPGHICMTCEYHLDQAISFRERCIRTHEIFSSINIQSGKNSEENLTILSIFDKTDLNYHSNSIEEEHENNGTISQPLIDKSCVIVLDQKDVPEENCVTPNKQLEAKSSKHQNRPVYPYKCLYCEKQFKSTIIRAKHHRAHAGERQYKCKLCNMSFEQARYLKGHIDSEGHQNKMAAGNSILINNQNTSTNNRNKFCANPPIEYNDVNNSNRFDNAFEIFLKTDQTQNDETNNLAAVDPIATACEIVKDPVKNDQQYNLDEEQSNEASADFENVMCERAQMGKNRYKCKYCDKRFSKPSNCRAHERVHTGERPFQCENCDVSFKWKQSLKRHINSLGHQNNEGFRDDETKCKRNHKNTEHKEVCIHDTEGEEKSTSLQKLLEFSTGKEENTCKTVSKVDQQSVENNRCFEEHEDINAATLDPTDNVHESNSAISLLEGAVLERAEEGGIRYNCKYCGKRFTKPSNCRAHERVHTGERPFICEICDVSFKWKQSLQRHINSLEHQNNKSFSSENTVKCNKNYENTEHKRIMEFRADYTKREDKCTSEPKPQEADMESQECSSKAEDNNELLLTASLSKFICGNEDCNIEFKSNLSRVFHERTHKGELRYKCKYCDKRFDKSSNCREHYRVHTGERPFKCDICEVSYKWSQHLKRHIKSLEHLNKKNATLNPIDNAQLSSFTECKSNDEHNRPSTENACTNQNHDTSRIRRAVWICDQCGKHFKDSQGFKFHMLRHTGNKQFACNLCDTKFYQNHMLQLHILTVHKGERPFVCRYENCDRKFKAVSTRLVHERTHTCDYPYKCHYCFKKFNKKSSLTAHQRVHTGERPYKCHLCEQKFKQKNTLKEHQRTHNPEAVPPRRQYRRDCDHCGQTFNSAYNYKIHILRMAGDKRFPCNLCDRKCYTNYMLQLHIRIAHAGERPFPCRYENCAKKFNDTSTRRCHERTHSQLYPFRCLYCNKGFNKVAQCNAHQSRHPEQANN